MPTWNELIDLRRFDALMRAVAVVLPVVGVLLGLAMGAARRALGEGLKRGVALGLLGPVGYGLWRLFAWLVRYDPQTGYCGLHRVSVLLLNVLLFVLVGTILGVLYGRLWRNVPAAPGCSDDPES